MQKSITVIIPALNEEANLRAAVEQTLNLCQEYFQECEILVFNDGSTDRTGKIADQLAKIYSEVKAIHHKTPQNLGGCYKEGLKLATKEFVIMVPGDNECGESVLRGVFSHAGSADIILPYTANSHVRPLGRRMLSSAFVKLLNTISGEDLLYYNGAVLHRTEVIRSYPIRTNSFGYQAEALVILLRRGHSYKEVGVDITYRPTGKSKALRWNNILETGKFVARLAWDASHQKSQAH